VKRKKLSFKINKIMNLLHIFRKPYLATLLAFLILFVSCDQYDNDIKQNIDAISLKSAHNTIVTDFNTAKYNAKSKKAFDENEKIFIKEFEKNLTYLNKNNLELLLTKNNISLEMLSAFEFYLNKTDENNIYEELSNNFTFSNEKEINFLFSSITLYDNLIKEYSNKSTLSKSDMQKISWGCAFAIVGTVAVTIGAIWVTGGGALLYWIFTKGLATAALIEACGDGWGDM